MTKFKPKLGQIDYSQARWAPVINCVVKYKDKILLVRRSRQLRLYPTFWNGISGFLDDQKSLKQKVREELKEEININNKMIKKIRLAEIFYVEAPRYKKTWIVFPVLVEIKNDKINLNWEASQHKWLNWRSAKKLKLVPSFVKVLEKLSPWLDK